VIVAVILLVRKRMKASPPAAHIPRLDVVGAVLSASGLAIIVLAILQSSAWGWVEPKGAPEIAGHPITPLGFSVVPFLVLGGLGLLWAFAAWEDRRARLGLDRLLDTALLSIVTLRAGLSTLFVQQLVLLGTFFVLPVYLQVIVGLDAFQTGLRLVPMSVAMLVFALLGPRLAAKASPRRVAQVGLVAVAAGATVLLATLDVELNAFGFGLGLAIIGVGAGLLASQLGNVIMSSVSADRTNEAGGLQGTAQNLGASMGTALIGAVLLAGLSAAFLDHVSDNPAIPAETRTALTTKVEADGLEVVPVAKAEEALLAAGVPADQATVIVAAYGEAEMAGLRNALGAVALFAVLGLGFTRRLPGSAAELGAGSEDASEGPPEAAPVPA
jgi:hypothetical protein